MPLMTWYSRMLASCSVVKLPAAVPIAWKAALDGAKIVTSLRLSTAEMRLVWVRAPASAVRLLSTAEKERDMGTVRTVSIICMTPPSNMRS